MAAPFATTAGVPRDNRAAISWGGDNAASRRLGRVDG